MLAYAFERVTKAIVKAGGGEIDFDWWWTVPPGSAWFETWCDNYAGLGCYCRYVRLGSLKLSYDGPKVVRAFERREREQRQTQEVDRLVSKALAERGAETA